MVEHEHAGLSVRRQCVLLGVNRSNTYYASKTVAEKDIDIMNEMRCLFQESPFYGYRRINAALQNNGYVINHKKVHRLMQVAGLKALYPKKNLSIKNHAHKIYPYLLCDLKIDRPNQVWQTDITYIKIRHGFVYLVCIIDAFSRKIMGWHMSPFLDTEMCMQAFYKAIIFAKPEILNSDQGCQFTSELWTSTLTKNNIQISMDGKGRWADNICIERFWRSLKYESVFLHSFDSVLQAQEATDRYIKFYNNLRLHQALNYKTPNHVYDMNLTSKDKEFKCFDSLKKGLPVDVATENFKNSHKQDAFWS
jgi:putative transposase